MSFDKNNARLSCYFFLPFFFFFFFFFSKRFSWFLPLPFFFFFLPQDNNNNNKRQLPTTTEKKRPHLKRSFSAAKSRFHLGVVMMWWSGRQTDSCAFKPKSVLLASISCTASSRPASIRKPRRELKQFRPEPDHPLWRIKIRRCQESRGN